MVLDTEVWCHMLVFLALGKTTVGKENLERSERAMTQQVLRIFSVIGNLGTNLVSQRQWNI